MRADTDTVAAFATTFRLDELTIHNAQGWRLSVRTGQITLGSMVISSDDGLLDFQALTAEEAAGLPEAFAASERLARDVFGAVRVNIVCLMMKDPIVHFHVVPRYDSPVDRYGREWVDSAWPGPPQFGSVATEDDVLRTLTNDLRAAY